LWSGVPLRHLEGHSLGRNRSPMPLKAATIYPKWFGLGPCRRPDAQVNLDLHPARRESVGSRAEARCKIGGSRLFNGRFTRRPVHPKLAVEHRTPKRGGADAEHLASEKRLTSRGRAAAPPFGLCLQSTSRARCRGRWVSGTHTLAKIHRRHVALEARNLASIRAYDFIIRCRRGRSSATRLAESSRSSVATAAGDHHRHPIEAIAKRLREHSRVSPTISSENFDAQLFQLFGEEERTTVWGQEFRSTARFRLSWIL